MKSLSVFTILLTFLITSCASDKKSDKKKEPAAPEVSYVGADSQTPSQEKVPDPELQEATRNWSSESKEKLKDMISKYGQPQFANEYEVTWLNNGQWAKTRLTTESGSPVLRQTAHMAVPPESLGDLATYNKNIAIDPAQEQVTVANSKEELNFLALNLAKEVVEGRMSPFEARRQYSTLSGPVRSRYLEGLNFSLPGSSPDSKQSQEQL